jgi:aminoglycoside phosphotransferase
MNETEQQVVAVQHSLGSVIYQLPGEFAKGGLVVKKRVLASKQQYRFEAFAYRLVRAKGVSVPQVLFADEDIILMTQLRGSEMDDREQLFDNAELFASIANDLARCHTISLPGFGYTRVVDGEYVGSHASWHSFLDEAGSAVHDIKPMGGLTRKDLEVLRSYWSHLLPDIQLEQGVLVHGDFAMSAIFVDGTQYTGLIDFGDALIGDPLLDIAYFRFKEITKTYGYAIYERLRSAYIAATGIRWTSRKDDLILFYMIFWGFQRLRYCPNRDLQLKFADKLHVVSKLI